MPTSTCISHGRTWGEGAGHKPRRLVAHVYEFRYLLERTDLSGKLKYDLNRRDYYMRVRFRRPHGPISAAHGPTSAVYHPISALELLQQLLD